MWDIIILCLLNGNYPCFLCRREQQRKQQLWVYLRAPICRRIIKQKIEQILLRRHEKFEIVSILCIRIKIKIATLGVTYRPNVQTHLDSICVAFFVSSQHLLLFRQICKAFGKSQSETNKKIDYMSCIVDQFSIGDHISVHSIPKTPLKLLSFPPHKFHFYHFLKSVVISL